MVGNGTDCTKKGISSREMHALQRLERHRTDKSILTAAMRKTIARRIAFYPKRKHEHIALYKQSPREKGAGLRNKEDQT